MKKSNLTTKIRKIKRGKRKGKIKETKMKKKWESIKNMRKKKVGVFLLLEKAFSFKLSRKIPFISNA